MSVWIHWSCVCVCDKLRFRSFFFFFFFFTRFWGMRLLFIYCSLNSSRKCWLFHSEQCTDAVFTDLQISLFGHFFIKNGSHGTIYTFKNYFATVFLVFNFSKISSIQTDPLACTHKFIVVMCSFLDIYPQFDLFFKKESC